MISKIIDVEITVDLYLPVQELAYRAHRIKSWGDGERQYFNIAQVVL